MNEKTKDTLVLGGFALVALLAVAVIGTCLYLWAIERDPPAGLLALLSSVGTFCLTTLGGMIKDYVGVKTP
jgi:hypothetical protein